MTEEPSVLINTNEACRLLDISRSALYKLVKQRKLPLVKIGVSTRFRRADIDLFVAAAAEPIPA